LPTTTKDKGIAPLEPDHLFAQPCLIQQIMYQCGIAACQSVGGQGCAVQLVSTAAVEGE
jgi:hypothetical protein